MAEPSLGEKGATEDHWGQKGDKPQATCGYSTELLLISQYGNGAWQKKGPFVNDSFTFAETGHMCTLINRMESFHSSEPPHKEGPDLWWNCAHCGRFFWPPYLGWGLWGRKQTGATSQSSLSPVARINHFHKELPWTGSSLLACDRVIRDK